jgi:uncharacterized protein (TIGR02284 family)
METAREATLSILEDLVNICKEENILFKTASAKISNPHVKRTINNCAEEKEIDVRNLETEIKRLGGTLDRKGPQTSQKVIDEFGLFNDDMAILAKCERIDDIVLNKYFKAMNGDILWEVVPFVVKQYFASVNLHDRIIYLSKINLQNQVNLKQPLIYRQVSAEQ